MDSITESTSPPVRVLLLDKISPSAIAAFQYRGYRIDDPINDNDVSRLISEANIIAIREPNQLTKEILANVMTEGPVAIGCFSSHNVGGEAAAAIGVPIFNAPFAESRSVAEIALACIIGLARGLGEYNSEMHKGIWKKSNANRKEVRGKTLGIVGYGHAGSQLSILAESIGMHVVFYDVERKMPMGNATELSSKELLLQRADFVSIHIQSGIKHVIGEHEISLMKKGSFLLSFTDENVIDLNALANALKSGHLQGAAVDQPGDLNADEKILGILLDCPNTFAMNSIGGRTEEAEAITGIDVAEKLIDYIETGNCACAANFPEIQLPFDENKTRIANVHRNVRGALSEINNVLSEYNISAQILGTKREIGYVICQTDTRVAQELYVKISSLTRSIRSRFIEPKRTKEIFKDY